LSEKTQSHFFAEVVIFSKGFSQPSKSEGLSPQFLGEIV
jgi:hypothetical protein